MQKSIQFTQQGFAKIQNELKSLQEKRPSAVVELSSARDLGDRSENAAYKVARQKLSALDRRIRELNRIVRFATVVRPSTSDTVEIGSKITVEHENKTQVFTIVGGYESDIENGQLSCYSPIGKSLLGKKSGAVVTVFVPAGMKEYKILNIENKY